MISITGMWVSLGIIAVLTVAAVAWVIFALQDRALTGDEIEAAAFIHDMHEANTGGLMALPAPGTTVKIPPRDQREVTRVIVHHETSGPAVPVIAAGPEHQPPAAAVTQSPTAAAGPHVPGRDSAGVATAMDAPQPRPAGDPATMSGPDYLAWVTERSEWDHETSWFSAIEVEA